MSGFIKEFYYGNIEPQEFSPELAAKLKSKLNALVENEKALDSTLKGEEKDLFLKYINSLTPHPQTLSIYCCYHHNGNIHISVLMFF